ncbi:hypothetical protein CITFRE_43940 [Citrobacter freundii]|nr:hypothetical protein CITFRE_43940 [Citrobacter freundii]
MISTRFRGLLVSAGIFPRIQNPIRIGMTMMASAAAPAMEYVFVNASGPNRRPSCPSRVKIGIKDRVMISRLMNNAGPTSTEASVITFQRVALSICSPGC